MSKLSNSRSLMIINSGCHNQIKNINSQQQIAPLALPLKTTLAFISLNTWHWNNKTARSLHNTHGNKKIHKSGMWALHLTYRKWPVFNGKRLAGTKSTKVKEGVGAVKTTDEAGTKVAFLKICSFFDVRAWWKGNHLWKGCCAAAAKSKTADTTAIVCSRIPLSPLRVSGSVVWKAWKIDWYFDVRLVGASRSVRKL